MNIETRVGISNFSQEIGKVKSLISLYLSHRDIGNFQLIATAVYPVNPETQAAIKNSLIEYIHEWNPKIEVEMEWATKPKLHPYDMEILDSYEFKISVTYPPSPRR